MSQSHQRGSQSSAKTPDTSAFGPIRPSASSSSSGMNVASPATPNGSQSSRPPSQVQFSSQPPSQFGSSAAGPSSNSSLGPHNNQRPSSSRSLSQFGSSAAGPSNFIPSIQRPPPAGQPAFGSSQPAPPPPPPTPAQPVVQALPPSGPAPDPAPPAVQAPPGPVQVPAGVPVIPLQIPFPPVAANVTVAALPFLFDLPAAQQANIAYQMPPRANHGYSGAALVPGQRRQPSRMAPEQANYLFDLMELAMRQLGRKLETRDFPALTEALHRQFQGQIGSTGQMYTMRGHNTVHTFGTKNNQRYEQMRTRLGV